MRLGQPERLVIGIAIAVSLIEVAASLIFPVLTREIIDHLGPGGNGVLRTRIVLLLAVVLAGGLAAAVSGYLFARSSQRFAQRLKQQLFTGLLNKPVAFFDDAEGGDLVSRITTDTQVLSQIGTKHLSGLINGLLLLGGSAIVLSMLDPALTLAILGIIGTAFLLMAPSFLKITAITKDINTCRAGVSAEIARVYGEVRLVKAMNAEAVEGRRIERRLAESFESNLRYARVEALLTPLNGLALTGAMIAIFTYGAGRVQSGLMTIGTLTVFILYIFNIVAPLIQISVFLTQFQTARGSSIHLCELLDRPGEREAAGPGIADAAAARDSSIRFENVKFSYPCRSGHALAIQALEFPAGSRTAIIGESGAGKTTIFSLIERFYALEQGQILCGGRNIAMLDLALWRARIGYVSQAAPLMNGTIAGNVTYGEDGMPNQARLICAAEAANCMDFIEALDEGFDTPVGEGGVLLSAGQKQRIALARMFYRNPDILLLDEATANLDEGNEAVVLRSIQRLMDGRTSIVVTHRPAALAMVDRVVVMERGAVTAVLSPHEAMAQREILRKAFADAA